MEKFIKLLRDFVSIRSVSTDPRHKKDIEETAMWLTSYCKKSGLKAKVIRGYDNPIVIAKTKSNPKLETVLIYGHYDVQPADKNDGWKSEPFSLIQKGGKLFGRGSADNKGQILIHLYSVARLLKEKRLGYNAIFLIEGNEETGSPLLKRFINDYKNELKSDFVVISDGELAASNSPALEGSFRGVANLQIVLKTASDDMHSGLFGGVVPNAALELSKLLRQTHDKEQKILVPGFYNDSKNSQAKNPAKVKNITGSNKIFAKNHSEYETRTGLHPAIEITSLYSGYLGEGFRNSIPSKAIAKINIRSGPKQNPARLFILFKEFIQDITPEYITIEGKLDSTSNGAELNTNNKYSRKAINILEKIYGEKIRVKHSGGTLPIVNDFKKILKIPQIMIPLANEDCGMHSASENISLACLKKGLEFSERFFSTP